MTEDPRVILARMISALDLMDDLIRDMQRTLNVIPDDHKDEHGHDEKKAAQGS